MLICVCGLPGSGKSYFSKRLAKHLAIERLNTDVIREEMKQLGQYSEDSRLAVYVEMAKRAKPKLLLGKKIIFDASFNNNQQRTVASNLAHECQVPIVFIRSVADEQTSLERVSKKREFTEADVNVYFLLKSLWEELEQKHLILDSVCQPINHRIGLVAKLLEESS